MSLKKCDDCEGPMSSWAKSCPHCGWCKYRPFLKISWVFVMLFCGYGLVELVFALASKTISAPQLGAVAASSVGLAVIPYVWTRAIEKFG